MEPSVDRGFVAFGSNPPSPPIISIEVFRVDADIAVVFLHHRRSTRRRRRRP
jgi:hypothetical protein